MAQKKSKAKASKVTSGGSLPKMSGRKLAAVTALIVAVLVLVGFAAYTIGLNRGASAATKYQKFCHSSDSVSLAKQNKTGVGGNPYGELSDGNYNHQWYLERGSCRYTFNTPDFRIRITYAGFKQKYDNKSYGECHRGNRWFRPNVKPSKIYYKGYRYYIASEKGRPDRCTNTPPRGD